MVFWPAVPRSGAPVSRRGGLFLKYVLVLVTLVTAVLLASGAIEIWFSYRENTASLLAIQQEQALGAAARIETFVKEIERQIAWTTQPQVAGPEASLAQRRIDFLRLQKQVPAITEVAYLDATGKEQILEHRLSMSAVGSQVDFSGHPKFTGARHGTWFGPVYFRKESEPYMTIAMPVSGGGVTAAEVNLKFIWDVVSSIQVGKAGRAYVVDAAGNLIAHPDISLVLRKTSFASLEQVRAALAAQGAGDVPANVTTARNLDGREVLTAWASIPALRWTVLAERPVEEAFEPLRASLYRTLALLGIGVSGAIAASVALARRMVRPIHALREGSARIAAGELGHRLDVRTGDEIEALAGEFNRMTERLQDSYATLERRVEERTRELSEALEQQTATAEILRVISRSYTDVRPVFRTIVDSATRLLGGHSAVLSRIVDDRIELAAYTHTSEAGDALLESLFPMPLDATGPGSRPIRERVIGQQTPYNVADVETDPRIGERGRANARARGYRSQLVVPMLRDGESVGTIAVTRAEPGAFTDEEIALLQTFADQAVIAIENVRLFTELEDRNRAVTEALEQQTATSEILGVISSSPTEVQPVFETIVVSGSRLFPGAAVSIALPDGDLVRAAAIAESDPAREAAWRGRFPFPLSREYMHGVAILDRRVVDIPDVADAPADLAPGRQNFLASGYRAVTIVPMMRGEESIGALSVVRLAVGPLSEKQLAVLRTFADQAVIAIENVHLFTQLQERTRELARSVDQLTALGEVSRAVSSTLDLDRVLNTVVTRASQLAGADGCSIYEYDEAAAGFRVRATSQFGTELADSQRAAVIHAGEGAVGRLIERREPVQISDIGAERAYESPLRDALLRGGYRALLAVPMLHEDAVVGGLVVSRKVPGEFPTETVELLRTFANQSALAVQNARLFREIEDKSAELEVANRHKSEFLASMSHELRTPLNAVIGFSEVLLERMFGDLNDKQEEYLRDIYSSGRHLLSLINDILDLAKIEAGKMELDLARFDLPQAIENAVTLVRGRADAHAIRLEKQIDPRLGDIVGDERKVKQILLNLLSNAVKFTPEGGRITVRATPADGSVEIAVTDTGIGIAPGDQAAVFEEFRQVGTDYARKREGTGLGLALTKRFVELHGGAIELKSALGEGSTFTFTLPVRPWPTSSS
jgi:signal transduction histidine kinase